MIAKEVTFENLDGEKITRKFWFNLNKAELAKMQLEHENFQKYIERVLETNDTKEILEVFDELLSMSYGVRGDDGVTFNKSPILWDSFKNSDAYSELFVELLSNPRETGMFFAGIVPRDFKADVEKSMKKTLAEVVNVDSSIFSQANPSMSEPSGEPTHELPQPPATASDVQAAIDHAGLSMKDRLAGMTEEEKQALREALL